MKIEPVAGDYSWIPEVSSVAISKFDFDNRNPYPVNLATIKALHDTERLRRNKIAEGYAIALIAIGYIIGAVATFLPLSYIMFDILNRTTNSLIFLAVLFLFVLIMAIGLMVGAIPGFLVEKSMEKKRAGTEDQLNLRLGNHERIHDLWNLIAENAIDDDDILYTLYEELTGIADEAARRLLDAGPAEMKVYDETIAELAGRIDHLCQQERAPKVGDPDDEQRAIATRARLNKKLQALSVDKP